MTYAEFISIPFAPTHHYFLKFPSRVRRFAPLRYASRQTYRHCHIDSRLAAWLTIHLPS